MTLEEAMRTRHTVRRYTEEKIPEDLLARLDERMRGSNERRGLAMSLVTENTEAFGPALKLFWPRGSATTSSWRARTGPAWTRRLGTAGRI